MSDRVVVLTGTEPRHIHFAKNLAQSFNVVGVFLERRAQHRNVATKLVEVLRSGIRDAMVSPSKPASLWGYLHHRLELHRYHQDRARIDQRFFGGVQESMLHLSSVNVIDTAGNSLNAPQCVEALQNLKPDVIAVLGTSLLRDQILRIAPGRTINIHSGLSPWYRGSECVFWPLWNEEPQYIGVTAHLINPGIDSGDIIHQARPTIESYDDEHTLFAKVIALGIGLMIQAVTEALEGKLTCYPQLVRGNLYLDKMLTGDRIRELHTKLRSGLIPTYLDSCVRGTITPPCIVGEEGVDS